MRRLMLFALVAGLFLCFVPAFAQPVVSGYKVGEMAADFKLKNTDGKIVSLASIDSTYGYIVIFTCNSCPYAQAYEERIIKLHQKYEKFGYPVVTINSNDSIREPEDSYTRMQERASAKKYPFVYLLDETQQVARAFGATRTPYVFLLHKTSNGNQVIYIGAIDDNYEDENAVKEKYLENALEGLLYKKPIIKTSTKAIGCGIKWRKN